jgi:multidrug resistance efflux pump
MVGLAAAGWWASQALFAPPQPRQVSASGIVESDEVRLSPEVTGRLVSIAVREGDQVRQGDVVARLNASAIQVQLRQADAATRQQLEIEAEKHLLRAPIAGVVTRVPMRVGETAVPGQTVVVIAEPLRMEVTLYVREREIGEVWVGQSVNIVAEAFPGRAFAGTVSWVNQRAQFTPRNIQAQRDRQNLVYAVKVQVENPDGSLKAGLPVDATFSPTSAP